MASYNVLYINVLGNEISIDVSGGVFRKTIEIQHNREIIKTKNNAWGSSGIYIFDVEEANGLAHYQIKIQHGGRHTQARYSVKRNNKTILRINFN